ncbi:hypothetical protein RHECNPAF_1330049 [Rhizobium etli CNPAF512]|nr:hypothetical protein RHECNPAF_1330049 [Rhizobium etli CNPAF512]
MATDPRADVPFSPKRLSPVILSEATYPVSGFQYLPLCIGSSSDDV